MRNLILTIAAATLAIPALPGAARAATTIRDLADIKGAQEQQIQGIGLVVGLRGTGDKSRETSRRMAQLLENGFKFNVRADDLATKNVALVMITARVRPFLKQGQRLDVTVSSIGDAASLENGILLPTPLHAADPDVQYVRAEGLVSVKSADGAVVSPTSGVITGGGIMECEIPCPALEGHRIDAAGRRVDYVELVLRRGDFRLAREVAEAINTSQRAPQDAPVATAADPCLVRVDIPAAEAARKIGFIAEILSLPIAYDPPATVVINERTGTVVVTGTVRINKATVTVGNIRVEIKEEGTLFPDFQTALRKTNVYSNAEIIAVIKELDKAKALQAKLVCE